MAATISIASTGVGIYSNAAGTVSAFSPAAIIASNVNISLVNTSAPTTLQGLTTVNLQAGLEIDAPIVATGTGSLNKTGGGGVLLTSASSSLPGGLTVTAGCLVFGGSFFWARAAWSTGPAAMWRPTAPSR